MNNNAKTGWKTAAAIVVGNMVGSGVFTSLGFQLNSTTNTISILLLWLLGAVMALLGAFSYAELGTWFKRSGGEYHFLSKIYHPLIGYLSGWVSLTVGFAAPVALAAISIGEYTAFYSGLPPKLTAVIFVIIISAVHSFSVSRSSLFQNFTTALKIVFILFFIFLGFQIPYANSAFDFSQSWQLEILMPAFAVSFVYVTFSYSGWNAAAYIIDEIKDVKRSLPKALIVGTLIVSILYVALNYVFLKQASLMQLQGTLEVGQVVARNMLGSSGGQVISYAISLLLISSISAMIWVGSRVTQVVGEDYKIWRQLSIKNKNKIPVRAIWFQAFIAIIFLLSGTFEQVLVYSGFILQLFCALTVGGVFIVRIRNMATGNFRSPLYPYTQIIFLLLSLWVLGYLMYSSTLETLYGFVNLILGIATYAINRLIVKQKNRRR